MNSPACHRCLVVIPTTEGPATITDLLREPALPESIVVTSGGSEVSALSKAYSDFMAQSDGEIASPGPWCLEFDRPIDTGESWQLGIALAHALARVDRLAFNLADAEKVLWITGAVQLPQLRVNPVDHIDRKFATSTSLLTAAARAGKHITVVLPAAQEVDPQVIAQIRAAVGTTDLFQPQRLADIETHLSLPPRRWRLRRRHWPRLVALCAGIVGLGAIHYYSIPDRLFPPRPTGMTFRDCLTCPEMVVVPRGSYWLNDFEPPNGHFTNGRATNFVHVARPFAIATTEVTLGLYQAFLNETGHKHIPETCGVPTVTNDRYDWKTIAGGPTAPGHETSAEHPVTCVSGHDAVAFAEWATRKFKRNYRLPTSVEWEVMARAGTRSAFSFGEDESRICEYVRFADATTSLGRSRRAKLSCEARQGEGSARVASLKPNAWGLYDTGGNVWEWTRDCPGSPGHARAVKQAQSLPSECAFSLLGGGWNSVLTQMRPGHRDEIQSKPHHRTSANGFRLAADFD